MFTDAYLRDYTITDWDSKTTKELIQESTDEKLTKIFERALIFLNRLLEEELSTFEKTRTFLNGVESLLLSIF